MQEKDLTYPNLIGIFREDYQAIQPYYKKIKEYRKIYAGDAWENSAEEPNKPKMNFNKTASIVDSIIGEQISKPYSITAVPKDNGDINTDNTLCDALNSGNAWFREKGNAIDQESQAYTDCVVSGLGYINTYIDWNIKEEGQPVIESINPLSMVHDRFAYKTNLSDANHFFKITYHSEEELTEMFGEKNRLNLGCDVLTKKDKLLPLIECRIRIKGDKYYKLPDGSSVYIKPKEGKYIELYKYKIMRLYLGKDILFKQECPSPYNSFGWRAITYDYDFHSKQFFGIIKNCIDPQRLYNRLISENAYNMSYFAKSGLIIEKDSQEDIAEIEANWTKPGGVTQVKNINSIKIKPTQELSASAFNMMHEANSAFVSITGISQEFIGTRNVEQAGILEKIRRQSTISVLMKFYLHLEQYRKDQFTDIIYWLNNWIPSDLYAKITGSDKPKTVYDDYRIILSTEPLSVNAKEETLENLEKVIPMITQLKENNVSPDILKSIISYTNLPVDLINQLKDSLTKETNENQKKEYLGDYVQLLNLLSDMTQKGLSQDIIQQIIDKTSLSEEDKTKLIKELNTPNDPNTTTQ